MAETPLETVTSLLEGLLDELEDDEDRFKIRTALQLVVVAQDEQDRANETLAEADLDPELTYRFIRDTVWVAVRWYRPGGDVSASTVADQYLTILLDGISRKDNHG